MDENIHIKYQDINLDNFLVVVMVLLLLNANLNQHTRRILLKESWDHI